MNKNSAYVFVFKNMANLEVFHQFDLAKISLFLKGMKKKYDLSLEEVGHV